MKKFCLVIALVASLCGNAQILYKIDGKDLPAPSYIFGSHHLSPISIVEESGVMDYFNQTQQVVGELDLTVDPMVISLALQPHMMAPADSTLSVLLAGEDMEALNAQFVKWAPMQGMQLQMLEPMKPMVVTTMMAVGMNAEVMPGFDPTQQLDSFFFQQGSKENKKIIGLETPEYQGTVLFDMTPLTVQAEALVDMLKNPDESVEMAKKLSQAYSARDLNAMIELSKEGEEHPEFMENILYKRNAEWLQKLPEIIESSPSFIVVGALHLAGPKGILEGLKNEGYTVTPIY